MSELLWSAPFTRGNRNRKGGRKVNKFLTVQEALAARQTHWNANHDGKRDHDCPACADLDREYSRFIHRGQ